LIVFSHPPELGKDFKKFGNIAKRVNGRPSAKPNPAIPDVNCQAPPVEDKEPASKDPSIGPVQEKDTIERVSAMKNTPKIPPKPSPLVEKLVHHAGKVSS